MSSHYYFVFNFLREVARSNLYQLVLDRKPIISVTVNIHRSNSTVTVQRSGNSKQVFKNKRFPPLTFLWLIFHFRQLFLNVISNTSRHCWNKKRQKWAMHSVAQWMTLVLVMTVVEQATQLCVKCFLMWPEKQRKSWMDDCGHLVLVLCFVAWVLLFLQFMTVVYE